MLEGVCGASSIVVSFCAGGEVLCGADVETAVSARKHVDVVHLNAGPSTRSFGHSLWAPFDSSQVLLMPLWLAMSEHCVRVEYIEASVPRQARDTIRLEK